MSKKKSLSVIKRRVLKAVADGPQTITTLAGGSLSHSVRKPIRQAVDALLAEKKLKPVSLRQMRAFTAADWEPSGEFLQVYFASLCMRDGKHLLWDGEVDRYKRCLLHINGKRYDMRRTLYEIKFGVQLVPSQTLRSRCRNENCMAPACQMLVERKGQTGKKHNVMTKQRLADAKRARSKYSVELIESVKTSDKSYAQIAMETGMPVSTVGAIKSGRLWKDYSNPFVGLMGSTFA